MEKWANFEYDRDFMIKVIAWWRVHNLVDAHVADAKASAEERAIKQAKRKGRR